MNTKQHNIPGLIYRSHYYSIFLFCLILFVSQQIKGQSQTPMGSTAFPVNDNHSSSTVAAVNGGWQINGLGKVNKIIRTSASTLYACSSSGGIFKSTDNGLNWNALAGTFLPGVQICTIAIDPSNPNIIYAGTGESNYASAYGWSGYGVLKSTNAGISWTISSTGLGNEVVSDIMIDPNNSAHLIASTSNGIYSSTNAGGSWTLQAAGGTWMEQMIQSGSSDTLFAVNGNRFFSSFDFGNSWNVFDLDPANSIYYEKGRIAIAPSNRSIIYVTWISTISGTSNRSEIFQSTSAGASFTKNYSSSSLPVLASYDGTTSTYGYGWANYCITVDPIDPLSVYVGAHLVFRSTDGAQSFTKTINNWWCCIHTDIHQLMFDPTDNNKVFAATDGGVFVSFNKGINWSSSSDGLYCSQYYTFGQSHVDSNYVVGGLQDNGIMFLHNDNTVHTYAGGDYSNFTLCDYFNPHNTYTSANFGVVFNPYDRASYASINLPTEIANVNETPCMEFSPSHAGRAFSYKSNVWITSNLDNYTMNTAGGSSTVSWTQLISLSSLTVMALAIAPDNDDLIYFIADNNRFYTCSINNGTLQNISNVLLPTPSNVTASIAVSTLNPDVIYVIANNKVYHTADAGQNFENITGNLPAINFEDLYIDPYSTVDGIYLVSDFGTYYKDWTLPSWTYLNSGFPSNLQNSTATFYQMISGSGIYKGSNSATSHVSMGTWGAGFQKVNFYRQKCNSVPADKLLVGYGTAFSTNNACYDNTNGISGGLNAYTLTTNSDKIADTTDQFSMLRTQYANDGSLSCTIFSVEKGDVNTPGQTGLMLRSKDGTSDAAFVMIGITGNGQVTLKQRTLRSAPVISTIVTAPAIPYPIELKLTRVGNDISAYVNGTIVGQYTIVLGDTLYGGIAAIAGTNSLANQTAFGDLIDSGFVNLGVGIKEINIIHAELFPDPAHDRITIQTDIDAKLNFEIYDILGKIILLGKIPANTNQFNIDISKIIPGNYFIKLSDEAGIRHGKMRFVKN